MKLHLGIIYVRVCFEGVSRNTSFFQRVLPPFVSFLSWQHPCEKSQTLFLFWQLRNEGSWEEGRGYQWLRARLELGSTL